MPESNALIYYINIIISTKESSKKRHNVTFFVNYCNLGSLVETFPREDIYVNLDG